MAVSTRFPTANEVETTGWTDPNNAHADDGVYATAAPGKNGAIGTRWLTFGFDGAIPANSTIDAVKIIYEYKVSTGASVATMRVRAQISGVNEENHDDTSEPLADTVITVDITADRAWTRADLLDAAFKVAGEGRRGNSNNAVTFSLDYIKVEVTYTPPSVALAGVSAGVAAVSGALALQTALRAVSAGVTSVSGALALQTAIAGASAGLATVSGALSLQTAIGGISAGVATVSGNLSVSGGGNGDGSSAISEPARTAEVGAAPAASSNWQHWLMTRRGR